MDIRTAIQEEHTRSQCDKIVRYIGDDKKKFAELMQCFLKGDKRVSQRAAWAVSNCVEQYPRLIQPYFKQLVEMLEKPGLHNAVIRHIVRMLQQVKIPAPYHGRIMNTCFTFIADPGTAVAIKAFSLTILANLARQYPDIKQELKLVIEERWDYETAAFKSRAGKILQQP